MNKISGETGGSRKNFGDSNENVPSPLPPHTHLIINDSSLILLVGSLDRYILFRLILFLIYL